MNKLLKLIIINFCVGGFFIALLAIAANKLNYGFMGNLLGSLPILTTYMVFFTHINGKDNEIQSIMKNAIIGVIVYVIFVIAFIGIYRCLPNVIATYFIALGIWILCQYILMKYILPAFNVKLLEKPISPI